MHTRAVLRSDVALASGRSVILILVRMQELAGELAAV